MKQTGFTLIEMIVVILLLAILSVTAIPRFINLSDEAKAAAVAGLAAEITSVAKVNFMGYQLSGVFSFGPSTPATSTKVISTSGGAGYGACSVILAGLFPNITASQGLAQALPGRMSVVSDQVCDGTGLSTGVNATCRIAHLDNTQISAAAFVPCTQ